MKKREEWSVTVEGNVDLFDMLKERIISLEITGTGGKVKVIGIRENYKEEQCKTIDDFHR